MFDWDVSESQKIVCQLPFAVVPENRFNRNDL